MREKCNAAELSTEEQDHLNKDEGELETLENEIYNCQESILPHVKEVYVETKKAFEKLWKEKDREEFNVCNYIENNTFQKHKMRTQSHHGGNKCTGVNIGILMGNAPKIIGKARFQGSTQS
jgi:hypothetical protein